VVIPLLLLIIGFNISCSPCNPPPITPPVKPPVKAPDNSFPFSLYPYPPNAPAVVPLAAAVPILPIAEVAVPPPPGIPNDAKPAAFLSAKVSGLEYKL